MRRGLPTIAWILAGLLLLSAFLISLGKRELFANPSIDSYGPSGTSALATLLRQRHPVRSDRRLDPRLAPGEVAIAFTDINPDRREAERTQYERVEQALRKSVGRGGRLVILPVPSGFQDASRALIRQAPVAVRDIGGRRDYRVLANVALDLDNGVRPVRSGDANVQFWSTADFDYVRAYRVGKGTVLQVTDATAFTNRFLDRADNAAAAVALIERLAPPGTPLVFTEAAFGNIRQPGLLETIGSWALAAWYQLLFLAGVVVYSFGRRFGLPEEDRRPQHGARELLDAVTDVYRRGKHGKIVLRTTLETVETDIRAALRLSRDAELAPRDDRLTPALRQAMADAQAALETPKLRLGDALPIARRLLAARSEFVSGAK